MRRGISANRRGNRGFSVVELIIALGLGLLVVAGIVQLFVGNTRTFEIVTAQARLQENARFAFDFIGRSVRSAGYFGCAPEDDKTVRHLAGNVEFTPEFDYTRPVAGWDSVAGGYTPDLSRMPRSGTGGDVRVMIAGNGIDSGVLAPGADILVVRSAEQPMARLAETMQPDGTPVIYTPGGVPSYSNNDVLVLADCEQASIFRVTGTVVAGDETTIAKATGGNVFDNNATITMASGDTVAATMSVVGHSYGAAATIARVRSEYYFLAESSETNSDDEAVIALWRKTGTDAPVELVQGVEDMQILYGIAAGAGNTVSRYVPMTAALHNDPSDIRALRISLTVNSVDGLAENPTDAGAPDQLRRTFTQTFFLRNLGA